MKKNKMFMSCMKGSMAKACMLSTVKETLGEEVDFDIQIFRFFLNTKK